MKNETLDLVRLQVEAEMLMDFVESNKELFSKNPLQIPLVPSDVHLLVKYIINDKYGFTHENQPDYDTTIGAYDKFISNRKDKKEQFIGDTGIGYFEEKDLGGVSPSVVLQQFKKSLAGNESKFTNLITYADKAQSDRIDIAHAITLDKKISGIDFARIYSPDIEIRFIDRARSVGLDILELNSLPIRQEHSDIQINVGEYEELKFKDRTVECDDKTKELFLKAGRSIIDAIERNDAIGKTPWLDPVFTLQAYNPKTGYQYGFENKALLNDSVSTNGFETALFMSFNEIAKILGLKIPKGTKGTPIIQRFGKKVAPLSRTLSDGSKEPVLDANDEQAYLWRRAAKTTTVFNLDQIEYTGSGVNPLIKMKEDYKKPIKYMASNQEELSVFKANLLQAIKIPVKRGGHTNSFHPHGNYISMADENLFRNDLQFIQTALHEWLHSIGHKDILKRESLYKYHTDDFYRGFEETLVNVGAVKLIQHYGLDLSELQEAFHNNEDTYNIGWAKQVFKKDPMQIIEAMYQAEEAFRYARTEIDNQLKVENVHKVFVNPSIEPPAPAAIRPPQAYRNPNVANKSTNKTKVTI